MAGSKQTAVRLDTDLLKRIEVFRKQLEAEKQLKVSRADALRQLMVLGLKQSGV